MYKKILLALIIGAAFASNSFSQIAYPVERPTLKVDDSWSYQRTDLWKNEVNPNKSKLNVASINDKGIYRMTGLNFNGNANNFNLDADLNGPTYKFQGNDMYRAWHKWPLAEGLTWEFSYKQMSTDGSAVVSNTFTCKVNGAERVKVPAGEFETVKRTCKGFWTNSLGGSGSNESILWYAPAAKRSVKGQDKWWFGSSLQGQTLDELVEFKVN
jgi:hypothetical protein